MKTTGTWCLSILVPLILALVYTASAHDTAFRPLEHIRQATAHFYHLKTAQVVGYTQFLDCVAEPGEGAMGIHFVHGELISDTVLDPLLPEALMYEPKPNGHLRLVGVECGTSSAAGAAVSPCAQPQPVWRASVLRAARLGVEAQLQRPLQRLESTGALP
jgi:hypothetical protein